MRFEDLRQELRSWVSQLLSEEQLGRLKIFEVPKGEYPSVGWGTTDLYGSDLRPVEASKVCFFPGTTWEEARTRIEVSQEGINSSWEEFLLGRGPGPGYTGQGEGIVTPTLFVGQYAGRSCEPASVGYTQEHREVLRVRLFLPNPVQKPRRVEEKEAKRKFAQEQFQFLRERGLSARAASRVMREAGPGQVRLAWALAQDWLRTIRSWSPEAESRTIVDAADQIFTGLGGSTGFGRARVGAALRAIGLWAPDEGSATRMWRVLKGAHHIVLSAGMKILAEIEEEEEEAETSSSKE